MIPQNNSDVKLFLLTTAYIFYSAQILYSNQDVNANDLHYYYYSFLLFSCSSKSMRQL